MLGTGRDVQPVSVDLLDGAGRHIPTSTDRVTFGIEGGEIIGVGNGDPNDHDSELAESRKLFAGLAQVLIRAPAGKGDLVLTAQVAGLPPTRLTIRVVEADPGPQIAASPAAQPLTQWRRAEFTPPRPMPPISIRPAHGSNCPTSAPDGWKKRSPPPPSP
jgi:beta-galactosidase